MTEQPATESVVLTTADGDMECFEARPEGLARGAVLVVQEAFGVNDHIRDVATRFAIAGYHAVAPSFFHRSGGGTAPYGDFSKVIPLFSGLTDDGILMDADATLAHLGTAGWRPHSIAVVGFCFGGRAAFLVAARRELGAAVGFYGGGIVREGKSGFPALLNEAERVRTPFLGLFGDRDRSITVHDVDVLRDALLDAPVETEVRLYEAAGHGFFCDQRPEFAPAAAEDAWDRTLAWIEKHLGDRA